MSKSEPMLIPLGDLVENDYNPRKRFDDAAMKELENSIRRVGLIQPLAVRKKGKQYEVIAGIRRFRALKEIEESPVPCNVVEVDDQEAQILSISENVARKGLTPMEEARAFARYFKVPKDFKKLNLNQEELEKYASEVGVSTVTVYKRLALLKLSEDVQEMVDNESITLGQAEVLTKVDLPPEVQLQFAQRLTDLDEKARKRLDKNTPPHILEFAQRLNKNTPPDVLKQVVQDYLDDLAATQEKRERNLAAAREAREASLKQAKETLMQMEAALADANGKLVETASIGDEDLPKGVSDAATWLEQAMTDRRAEFVGSEAFDKWVAQRAAAQEQLDRLLVNRQVLSSNPTLGECPYCGAGIDPKNLNRRIEDLKGKIEECDAQEAEINQHVKDIDVALRFLKNARKAYDLANAEYNNLLERMKDNG